MELILACDLMMDLEGPVRPAWYLAEGLVEKGCRVSIISPMMSTAVEDYLRKKGIEPVNLQRRFLAMDFSLSLLWFESWGREAFLGLNSTDVSKDLKATINFSHTMVLPSRIWYIQGPTSVALKDMDSELTGLYRVAYHLLKPVIEWGDAKLINDMNGGVERVIANSNFCASMYRKWGIEVEDVIYPPIDCEIFHPEASDPSSSYVLTYFGKETKFSIIRGIADSGVKIKAFGSKAPFVPSGVTNHPQIDFLGKISTAELVDAYSNALFTLFPFTHEPFGYIPVESMACGTPVLTYNRQGPGESIIDGHTGWLAENDEELVVKAIGLWNNGYPTKLRGNCVEAASKFGKNPYIAAWWKVLRDG